MSILDARFLFFSSRSALSTAEFAESILSFSKTLRTGTEEKRRCGVRRLE
jgi:hypothetical protein